MEVITKSADETQKVGREFANKLTPGAVVALVGDLGAGKTTFVQGVADGLGVKEKVNSPTFIIMRTYKPNFCHVDLYRLESNISEEVENLGLLDLISEGESVILIEWAEKIRDLLPKNAIWVKMEDVGNDTRKITL